MLSKSIFVRLGRLLASVAIAAGLLVLAGPASASGGSGWLRLAHLFPDAPAGDVYPYSLPFPLPPPRRLVGRPRCALRHMRGKKKREGGDAPGAPPPPRPPRRIRAGA